MDRLMVGLFLDAFATPPEEIVLDLDATDDPLHGTQEGRHFHAFYDCYCYLPLYIFCGEHILCARLRSSDVEAAHGCVEELARIVAQIRARWPDVRIVVRGDSGFCRDALMTWCEAEGVDFVLGLQKNSRLLGFSVVARAAAHIGFLKSREPTRVFTEFEYSTRDSWSRARRVVAKAEHSAQGPNPRYVVTSLPAERADPRTLYEDWYCARGDMENRIKEQQLDLFADRTSTHTLRANQIRLYFSSFAYALLCALRRLGLADTELATAQCGTLRVRLLKVGAQVRVSVRKVWIAFSESFPAQAIFIRALRNIRAAPPGFSIA